MGLVGGNGAGKSTLVKLLLRFYDPGTVAPTTPPSIRKSPVDNDPLVFVHARPAHQHPRGRLRLRRRRPARAAPGIDTSSSHSAWAWDYWLGGKDNHEVARIVGDRVSVMLPDITVDGRTDEYALACAAFELLSGQPPFPRDEGMAVLYAQLSAEPPSLVSRRPGLPPGVDEVLRRAMAKALDGRYPSCGQFAAALGTALGCQPPGSGDDLSLALDHPATEVAWIGARDVADSRPTRDAAPRPVPPAAPAAPAGPRSSGRAGSRRGILAVASIAVLAAGGAFGGVVLAGNAGKAPSRPASLGRTHPVGSAVRLAGRPKSSPSAGSASRSAAPSPAQEIDYSAGTDAGRVPGPGRRRSAAAVGDRRFPP